VARGDRERWDRRYAQGEERAWEPDWLDELAEEIPERGRALDVAAGTGRVALWLAARGLDVTAVDVSPVGLERCLASARERGVAVQTVVADLEEPPLPAGPWDVITCFHYLQRDLFPRLVEHLSVGGVLICELPTRRNLERHPRPGGRYLLGEGELLSLCAPLRVVYYREGWIGDRALARAIARRPSP
jgi:SAM-dependent methyltransferase